MVNLECGQDFGSHLVEPSVFCFIVRAHDGRDYRLWLEAGNRWHMKIVGGRRGESVLASFAGINEADPFALEVR